jgi:hypothetical protein
MKAIRKTQQPQQRKILIGSFLPRPGRQLPAQAPPKPSRKTKTIQETAQVRVKEWIGLKLANKHHSRFDFEDILAFRFSMPTCIHGVELNKQEGRLEWPYKRKYFFPISFNCFECNPTCKHGCPLSKVKDSEAIQKKERVSQNCPECDPSITNPRYLNAHLHRKGLGVNASRGLLKGCVVTDFGQVITNTDAYFSLRGGSKNVEEFDAQQLYGNDSQSVGHGSDDPEDIDGITTDELGDPLWSGLSDASKHAEEIRTRETQDTLWLPTFEVKRDSPGKWYILKDNSRVTHKTGETHCFKTKRAAELYTNRLIIQEEVIEHNAQDVLALI